MLKFLLSLASKAAGPWAWVLSNWKLVLVGLLVVVYSAYWYRLGGKHNEAGWQKKERAREAREQLIDAEHKRQLRELEAGADAVDAKYEALKAARAKREAPVNQGVIDYVANRPGTGTDIGPDGVQLVNDAIRSRRVHRAGEGEGGRPGRLQGSAASAGKPGEAGGTLGR